MIHRGIRTCRFLLLFSLGASCDTAVPAPAPTSADAGAADGAPPAASAPCVPFGSWRVTYAARPDAGIQRCIPDPDTLVVEQDPVAMVRVTFVGRSAGTDTCSPSGPRPGRYESTSSWSMDSCTLTAASRASWCFSGENP